MKSTLIKGKAIAAFDSVLMKIIQWEDTSERQIEKESLVIGIRNEQEQLYRVIGLSDIDMYCDLLQYLEDMGFTNELDDKPPKKGRDAILKLNPKITLVFEESDQ